jgi:hypothetical protein
MANNERSYDVEGLQKYVAGLGQKKKVKDIIKTMVFKKKKKRGLYTLGKSTKKLLEKVEY